MIATSTGILLSVRHLAAGAGRRTTPVSAAAIQGSVYVGDHVGTGNTNGPATVYAFRASDGKLRWRRSLPCPLVAPVVVGTGMVYAYTAPCNQNRSALYALRSSDGVPTWHFTLLAPWASPTT